MSGAGPLVLLWLLSQRGKGGDTSSAPPHGGGHHGGTPHRGASPHDPFHMPPAQGQPVAYQGGGGGASSGPWISYSPLHPDVVARAQALLHDVAAPPETIEPDPHPLAPGGIVRYLKTHDNPPGHTSVTAWRHRTEVHPSPGTPAPGHITT